MALLELGHSRSYRRVAAGLLQGLRAGWISGQTKPEYTAARGRHDHATFQEHASVLCTGLGARLLAMADEALTGRIFLFRLLAPVLCM